jgi:hypothetical protein
MTGIPKNLFNKIRQMIFQFTSSQRNDIAALQTAVGTYKEYVATITQSTTSAPAATVLNNTLGGTLVWTRSTTGTYLATLTAAFPTASKVVILTSVLKTDLDPLNDVPLIAYTVNSANTIQFITATMDNAGARTIADSAMDNSLIIRVYP